MKEPSIAVSVKGAGWVSSPAVSVMPGGSEPISRLTVRGLSETAFVAASPRESTAVRVSSMCDG